MPAYDRLAARIREQIACGELGEGARLPSEIALASQAGVSRSTVREALRTLQEAGLIERASPRVLVVSGSPGDGVSQEMRRALRRRDVTFRHLLEALLAMEPDLARLAAVRAEPADLEELSAILDRQQDALDDFDEWNRLDEEYHLLIARIAASPALATARSAITGVLLGATRQFVRERAMTAAALEFHRRILAELEAGDGDGAALMSRAHVNDFSRAWARHGLDLDLAVGEV